MNSAYMKFIGQTNMQKSLLLAIFVISYSHIAAPLLAQSDVENFRPDAHAIGLGGSLVTQARDPAAIFWNPATLSGLKDRSILMSINDPFEFNLVSFTQFIPLYGTFGVGLSRISSTPESLESVDRGTLAWGRALGRWFSFGGSLNFEKFKDDWFATATWSFFIGNPRVGTLENRWREFSNSKIFNRLNLGLTIHNIPLGDKFFETSALFGFSYLLSNIGLLINSGYHVYKGENTTHLGLGQELNKNITVFTGIEELDLNKWAFGLGYTHDNFVFNVSYSTDLEKLLFTLSARISPAPAFLAAPHYNRGANHLETGNYRSASREFRKYLSYEIVDSKTDTVRQLVYSLDRKVARTQMMVDSLFAVSKKLLDEEDPQFLRAALILTRIKELDPENAAAGAQLKALKPAIDGFIKKSLADGIYEFESNRYVAAKNLFKRVLLFEQDNATALYYTSNIDKILGDLGEEYFYRGVGYYRQKNYQRAKEEFRRALKYNPQLKEAISYLNRANEKIGEQKRRIAELLREGQTLEKEGKHVEATNKYLEVLKIDKENDVARAMIVNLRPKINRFVNKQYIEGLRYFREENFQEAEELLTSVLSIEPNHVDAKRNLAELQKERSERASFYLTQAAQFFQNEDWQRAMELYSKTLTIDPSNEKAIQGKRNVQQKLQISSLIEEGRKQFDQQNYIAAINVFENILKMDPGNKIARAELNDTKSKIKELVESYFNTGINLYTLDKYEEAIQSLDNVLELEPDHKGAKEYKQQALERIKALKQLK